MTCQDFEHDCCFTKAWSLHVEIESVIPFVIPRFTLVSLLALATSTVDKSSDLFSLFVPFQPYCMCSKDTVRPKDGCKGLNMHFQG